MPLVGNNPVFTNKCMSVWIEIKNPIEYVTYDANISSLFADCLARINILETSKINVNITKIAKNRPSSSAITAKIKSLYDSGR